MTQILLIFFVLISVGCSLIPGVAELERLESDNLEVSGGCHPMRAGYRQSIVKLDNFSGVTASGVIIAKNRVITVAHVIRGNHRLHAQINGSFYEARVISVDRDADLAYLAVDTGDIMPSVIANHSPVRGEHVWAASFPLASRQRVSMGFFEALNNGRLYTSVHINSGSSGGGLFRCEEGVARLVGVIRGFVALSRNGNIINIGDSTSVPAHQVREFIGRFALKTTSDVLDSELATR